MVGLPSVSSSENSRSKNYRNNDYFGRTITSASEKFFAKSFVFKPNYPKPTYEVGFGVIALFRLLISFSFGIAAMANYIAVIFVGS